MPNYTYVCTTCSWETVENYSHATRPQVINCACCATETAEYQLSAPNVMRASYPDGTKRAEFAEGKEAIKLQKEMSEKAKTQEQRKQIAKEISKLGVRITKE